MSNVFNRKLKILVLFLVGGFVYGMMEILSRGYSHISMFCAGGLCLVLIDYCNHKLPSHIAVVSKLFIFSGIITLIEFVIGILVNQILHLGVWDYSHLPYNLLGQICLIYFIVWFLVSFMVLMADEYICRYWFGEHREKIKFF